MTRTRLPLTEHHIQAAVFAWRDLRVLQLPELQLLHAIPNGAGLRHKVIRKASGATVRFSPEGKKLKREGLTKGIPDVGWAVARGRYHGLYIEHKKPGEPTSDAQQRILTALQEQSYYVIVSCDAEFSIKVIEDYWSLGRYTGPTGATMEDLAWPNWRKPAPRTRKTKEKAS